MTLARRAALAEHEDVLSFGRHPAALRCSSRREAARSQDALLVDHVARRRDSRRRPDLPRVRRDRRALRRARQGQSLIEITQAEQACANRIGSVDPLRDRGVAPTTAQLKAVGTRVRPLRRRRRRSRRSSGRRLQGGAPAAGAIPCVREARDEHHVRDVLQRQRRRRRQAKAAEAACRWCPGPGTSGLRPLRLSVPPRGPAPARAGR